MVQGTFGAFDTLYYHEYKLRLPAQPPARKELMLHASRDFVYALLFCTIGWVTWNGLFAWVFLLLLAPGDHHYACLRNIPAPRSGKALSANREPFCDHLGDHGLTLEQEQACILTPDERIARILENAPA